MTGLLLIREDFAVIGRLQSIRPTDILEVEDKDGRATYQKGLNAISDIPPFAVVWLTNNLPYAIVWEEGTFEPSDPGPSKDKRPDRLGRTLVSGGYSTQAPRGMVAITLEELKAMFGE